MLVAIEHSHLVPSILIITNHVCVQWNLSKPATLGTSESVLIRGVATFQECVLESILWDFSKWPEYRGGHISEVLIRGIPMYIIAATLMAT